MPADPEASRAPEVLAAVDLGSNSFHMVLGELRHGQLTIIDRIKETVPLWKKEWGLDGEAHWVNLEEG